MFMKNVKKVSTTLTNTHYNTSKTSSIAFRFEPYLNTFLETRMRTCSIQHSSIENKDIYFIDNFFSHNEAETMRKYAAQATFSRNSYGSPEAIDKGEEPARSMDNKERWSFFSHPPEPIDQLYQFFGMLAHCLDVDVTTLPWELCDAKGIGSASVIVNFLEKMTHESMELGKHRDCDPSSGISFGVPVLYETGQFHPSPFINGAIGKPWLISVMLYVTDAAFLPEYRLGTVFYNEREELALKADCLPMRIVIFEGDIIHSIEASQIPASIKTWRVSCVFKLVLNPKTPHQSIKRSFSEWLF
jgi:hypothetical protein